MVKKKNHFSPVQKITIVSILICCVLVITAVVCGIFNQPENQTKRIITDLATDYYENYLYEYLSHLDNFKNNPDDAMKLYSEYGFSPVNLRQFLLYDDQKNAKYADYLKKYCDENQTLVKFYPEAPYGVKNYRIKYTYSCEF